MKDQEFDVSGFVLILVSDEHNIESIRKSVTDEFDTLSEYRDVVIIGEHDAEIKGNAFLIHIKNQQSMIDWAESHNIGTLYVSTDVDTIGTGEQTWMKLVQAKKHV